MLEALILLGVVLVTVPLVAVVTVRDAATHHRVVKAREEYDRRQRQQAAFEQLATAFVDGLSGAVRAAAEALTGFVVAMRAMFDTPIYQQVQRDYALAGEEK